MRTVELVTLGLFLLTCSGERLAAEVTSLSWTSTNGVKITALVDFGEKDAKQLQLSVEAGSTPQRTVHLAPVDYRIKLSAFDANGKPVPKTAYGSKLDKVLELPADPTNWRAAVKQGKPVFSVANWSKDQAFVGNWDLNKIFSPAKPGRYRIEFRIVVFEYQPPKLKPLLVPLGTFEAELSP